MPVRDFLAGHPLRSGASFHSAAHDRPGAHRRVRNPRSRVRRPRRSAGGHRPRRAPRSATSATAPSPPRSRPASQRWRAALDHLIVAFAKRPIAPARSGDRRHPAPQRLSAAAPHARAGLGGRGRCGGAGADGRKKRSASGFVNARAADDLASADQRCRCRRGRPIPADRAAALDYLSDHAVASALAGRALAAIAIGFDGAEQWLRVQQSAGAPDAARQSTPDHARRTRPRARGAHGDQVHAGRFAPDALIVDEGQPLRGARRRQRRVRRAGRGVAARGAAGRRVAGPAAARHLRVARRQDHRDGAAMSARAW